jgi:hypothetical protein
MKRLLGGLCCASFILTATATLFGPHAESSAEDRQNVTITRAHVEQSGSEEKIDQKAKAARAASLEIVTMKGCPPCRRLKVVAIRLLADGYDVTIVKMEDDTRGSDRFPSLYYLNKNGKSIRKETGFKTYDHIVQYLRK